MEADERRLRDIVACANELELYLRGLSADAFAEDRLVQRATERLLTIIGGAAKQLSDETRATIPQPWREIIWFRDKGIHGYDSMSARTLYRIATESVPALRKDVLGHLGD